MLLLGLMLHFMLLKDANTGLLTFVVYRDLFTMQMLTQEVWRGARPPPEICISNQLPRDTDAAGPATTV